MAEKTARARPRVLLLGTIEVDGVTLGSVRLRTLLAHLALTPGRAVPGGTLVDGCYGTDLPRRPAAALQVLMTRLRKRFADPKTPLVSSAGGYVLRLDEDDIDLALFLRAAADALAPGATDEAIEAAERALALWGEPFAGCVPSERLETAAVQARERFLRVLERLADARLERNAPGDAEAAAEALLPHLPSHRDRERLVGAAMRALHRLGRTVEALAAFAETRRALRVDHGVDPGPALRELEAALLATPRRVASRQDPVVGRADLLAVVRARLDDTERGALVIAVGEAGIGKTSLLRAAREEARVRGAVTGSGAWNEADTPLAAWAEGLRDLGTPVPARDPDFGRTVHRVLHVRAGDAPLLLTLDDAHRADSASLGTLLALARRGLPAGIVVIVAAREPDAITHPRWEEIRADLVRLPGVHELAVRELDHAAVAELLELRGRERDDAGSLWTRSAGHPLHLAALLDVLDRDEDQDEPGVPDRLRPLLAYQLARLPAACREVLEALAVLEPLSADALAEVLGLEPRRVLQALRPAADLGLVVPDGAGYAFRHELTAAAARGPVPEPERNQLHRTRLSHLAADAEPFERLRHAVGAATMVPRHVVADARVAAAATAKDRGALVEALTLLDATDDASDLSAARVARGLVLQALGRIDESDDVLDAVVEDSGAPVQVLIDAAVGADAVGIAVAGRPRRLARLQRVRHLPLERHDRVRMLRALIVEQQQFLGDAEADAMPELLALAAETPDDLRLQAEVALLRGNQLADEPIVVRERIRHAERAHGLAVATGDRELRLEAEELLVASLLAAGRLDDAEALRAGLRSAAARHRHARSIWACLLVDASLQDARGDAEAAGTAENARDRGVDLGIPDAFGAYGVHLAAHHLLAGTLPSLNGLPAGAAAYYPHVAAWAAVAAADAAQAGDAAGAAAHLAEWTRRREGRPFRLFDRPGLCCAAVAAFALGDADTARAVLAGLPPDPEAVVVVGIGAAILGPAATYQGLALLAAGEPEPARQSFKVAFEFASRLGWTPWADAAVALGRFVETGSGPLPFGLARLRS